MNPAVPPERSVRLGLQVDAATSRRLAGVRRSNTSAEVAVRKLVHALGLRYRIVNKDLPGSPDIANRSAAWAIFVHGCFWHSHSACGRATVPKRNRRFWLDKFADNRERDARKTSELRKRGYRVLVIWECDLKRPAVLKRRLVRVLG